VLPSFLSQWICLGKRAGLPAWSGPNLAHLNK
jgi:hypothetical protein